MPSEEESWLATYSSGLTDRFRQYDTVALQKKNVQHDSALSNNFTISAPLCNLFSLMKYCC